MIAYIDGKLTNLTPTYAIIDVSGIGYQVNITLHTYSEINAGNRKQEGRLKLYTYMHIKEDAHTLYGFYQEAEKKLFSHLISVSGIGPSVARMILSSANPQEVEQAIVSGEASLLQSIKGIGPKSAGRIILELQDKLKKEGIDFPTLISSNDNNSIRKEALSALIMLGFSKKNAESAVFLAIKQLTTDTSVDILIRESLKHL